MYQLPVNMEMEIMSHPPVPLTQRRRQRIPAAQIRELMLNEAHRVVSNLGVTASLEDLSMEDLIAAAGVPRASVYRIWPYRGDFIGDLLEQMAGPDWFGTGSFDPGTLELAVTTLFDQKRLFGTAEGRRAALLEAVRLAADRNLHFIATNPDWRIYIALIATSGGAREPQARARVAAALARSDAQFTARMARFYEMMCPLLGLRLRDPSYTFEHFAIAGAAVVEGLALRRVLVATAEADGPDDPRARLGVLVTEPVSGPGIDGDAEWSLAALGFLGVLDVLIEPVPDFDYDPSLLESLDEKLVLRAIL